nr:3-oxoacyl-ACP reductase [Nitratireductor sp.]
VIEGAKNGIRVNCIAPTAATRMTEDILTPEMLAMLKPEFVTPAALFLVAPDAPNRTVMLAGAGYFATIEIRESLGMHLPEGERTPETIAASFGEISSMEKASVYRDGREHVAKILSAASRAAKN